MKKIFFLFGFIIVFLFFGQYRAYGNAISLSITENINFDPADPGANFREVPKSFCSTEDGIFLFPDYKDGTIKIFGINGKYLTFIKKLGPKFDKEGFGKPMYCSYSPQGSMMGVIDESAKQIFVFSRTAKVDFKLVKTISCPLLGNDIEFAGEGNCLVVSGHMIDREKRAFDLYNVNLGTGGKNYLLASQDKYDLKGQKEFLFKYETRKSLPAIGIKAFIDIFDNDVFFVWEGNLRIIKLNLISMEKKVFRKLNSSDTLYTKPNGVVLAFHYRKEDYKTVLEKQKKYSYITDIFATSRHVFVIYETGKIKKNTESTFRLQTYTPEGMFLDDSEIKVPDKSGYKIGPQICLDKENYDLYVFAIKKENKKGEFSILKYKIETKKGGFQN